MTARPPYDRTAVRPAWEELPAAVRHRVAELAGAEVIVAEVAGGGFDAWLALIAAFMLAERGDNPPSLPRRGWVHIGRTSALPHCPGWSTAARREAAVTRTVPADDVCRDRRV